MIIFVQLPNIPPGVSHRLFDVTEELEIFDVFIGPIL